MPIETETGDFVVSKQDVKALKQCDRLSFHFHDLEGLEGEQYTFKSWINATKEVKSAGPFDEREREWVIPCRSLFRTYQGDPSPQRCFSMLHGMYEDSPGPTFARLVKPGDCIRLHWIKNNDNGYMRESDGTKLHRDELHVSIERPQKNGQLKRVAYLRMDSSICPDNTARMVQ